MQWLSRRKFTIRAGDKFGTAMIAGVFLRRRNEAATVLAFFFLDKQALKPYLRRRKKEEGREKEKAGSLSH